MTTTVARASFDFSGTTTVITGGASGIGLSCAEAIARAGGGVIISSSRNPAKTDAALQRLRALAPGVPMSAHPCEVGDEASVAGFFGAIAAGGARVDHLIHSAGVSPNTDFLAQTQAEWDQVHNINATGSFLVTKHAAGLMRHNEPVEGWRGRIVLITSTNGINSNDPVSAHYDSSKAGNNMLVRNAAEALAPLGIVVNGVLLISVQKVTVRASPQSEHWHGVGASSTRKCLSRLEFLLVSRSAAEGLFAWSISAASTRFRCSL